jgi:hypothetical protein
LDYVGKSRDGVEGYELVYVEVQAVTSPVTTGRIRGVIQYVT